MIEKINAKIDELEAFFSKNSINGELSEAIDFDYFQNHYDDLLAQIIDDVEVQTVDFRLDFLFHLLNESAFMIAQKRITINPSCKTIASNRLIIMFLKSLNEARYLIHGGFSSAALSILRKSFEIGTLLDIIIKNDETASDKYLKYSNVARFKIAKSLRLSDLKSKIVKELKEMNINDFEDYSWLKEEMKLDKISFKQIVKSTCFNDLYYLYELSCKSTHAEVFDSISGVDNSKKKMNHSSWNVYPSTDGKITAFFHLLLITEKVVKIYYVEKNNFTSLFILYCLKNLSKNNFA